MFSAETMRPFTAVLAVLACMSGTIAQHGQIQYNDNTGVKVDWRYFAPQTEFNSRLESSQRSQRADGQTNQPQRSQYQTPQYQTAQPQAQAETYGSQQQAAYQSAQAQSYPSTYQKSAYQSAIRQEPAQLKQSVQSPAPQSQLAVQQLLTNQNVYKPYSAVPSSIKQLLLDVYKPQRPYVDPSAFIYNLNFAQPTYDHQQSATAEYSSNYEEPSYQQEQKLQTRRDYSERQGRIEYKDDQYQQQQQQPQYQQQQHQYQQQQQQQQPGQVYQLSVPFETTPYPSIPRLTFHKGTPTEIQQLLQYQAQLPYDVTANRIAYTPKQPFIPKQFNEEDSKGPYYYRSKVYYSDGGETRPEYETSKPVEEKEAN